MIRDATSCVIPGGVREREDPGPRGDTGGWLPHVALGPGSRAGTIGRRT